MKNQTIDDLRLPTLSELGTDLLATTPRQRWLSLARPLIGLAAYAAAAYLGLWWLTPVLVFLIFVAVVTVTHDVVHGSIGLGRRQSELALFLMGAILLESGHAYRITHRQHHLIFPDDDDPEGYPARISLLGAIVYGPVFLWRLWWWSFERKPAQRVWLVAELCVSCCVIVLGITLWNRTPAVMFYAAQAIIGSWVYPLLGG